LTTELFWRITPMTEEHGRIICTWKYPSPYDVYNSPSWEHMIQEEQDYADAQIRAEQFGAVVDAKGQLSGFVQYFPIVGVTRLGLGLRPDLCGGGLGTAFVQFLVAEAKKRAPHHEIDLEVPTWNERAQRSYLKAGFELTDTYERMTPHGMATFHCMVYVDAT
jgi:ribosomal-protein-alanine N-acetyltransferase